MQTSSERDLVDEYLVVSGTKDELKRGLEKLSEAVLQRDRTSPGLHNRRTRQVSPTFAHRYCLRGSLHIFDARMWCSPLESTGGRMTNSANHCSSGCGEINSGCVSQAILRRGHHGSGDALSTLQEVKLPGRSLQAFKEDSSWRGFSEPRSGARDGEPALHVKFPQTLLAQQ